jgi:hypothetical protein
MEPNSAHPLRSIAALLAVLAATCGQAAQPGDGRPELGRDFPSAEAAFFAVFIDSGLGERAYREDREYAAALYQTPDGRWHSTDVLPGDRDRSRIPYHAVPADALSIAGAHTHGQPDRAIDPQRVFGQTFSSADCDNALHNFVASRGRISQQFLLSSDLRILRMTFDVRPQAGEPIGAAERSRVHARTDPIGKLDLDGAQNPQELAVR